MKQIISILLTLGLLSCSNNQTKENTTEIPPKEIKQKELNYFELISDFEKNTSTFDSDTFNLMNHSTEGGELIMFHTNEKDYLVLDFWLYGETGKLNTTYWTDHDIKLKIVKRTEYDYVRPAPDYKITQTTQTTQYYSYSDSTFKVFDQEKTLIQDSSNLKQKEEIEEFFTELTKDIKLIK